MRSYDVMLIFVVLWFVDFIALTVILLKERNNMELKEDYETQK